MGDHSGLREDDLRILILAKKGESLTGAGTYQSNVLRELAKRHTVKVYERQTDLDESWDIVHCLNLKHLRIDLAKKLCSPLVVDAHDYYWIRYYHFFCLDFPLRFILQKYRKIYYHFLFKYIDGIILHGQFLYDLFEHPNKYLNFYFALDYSGIVPRPWEERENLILFVGGDFFRKGLPRLLRALPLVLAKVPDARVLVIGNDHWHARRFARFLSGRLPVEFIYGMPRDEVYRTYARGKVLVLPSEIEATPLVLAEATMAGVPPIASDVGGHPQLIQDGKTGFIFPLADTEILADRIVSCLTDKQLSESLTRGGMEFLSRFTVDEMMEQLEGVYKDVIRKAGKSGNISRDMANRSI